MITVGSITDWVGLPVLDRDGSKIGSMEAVYFDTSTDEPVFITVKVGLIGSSLVFVPLADAVVSPKDLRVAVDKKLAKDAPSIETDGQLESAMEPTVLEHYGLPTPTARRASAGRKEVCATHLGICRYVLREVTRPVTLAAKSWFKAA